MSLSPQEAFRVGFVARCIENGLTDLDQIAAAAAQARAKVASFADAAVSVGKAVLSPLLSYGLPLAAIAPPVVGGLAGYGLARATDVDDTGVADIKQQELLRAYKTETDKLKRQKALRAYRQAVARHARF